MKIAMLCYVTRLFSRVCNFMVFSGAQSIVGETVDGRQFGVFFVVLANWF